MVKKSSNPQRSNVLRADYEEIKELESPSKPGELWSGIRNFPTGPTWARVRRAACRGHQ